MIISDVGDLVRKIYLIRFWCQSRNSINVKVRSLSAHCHWRQTGSLEDDTVWAGHQVGVLRHAILLTRLLHLARNVSSTANDSPGGSDAGEISVTDALSQETVTAVSTDRVTGWHDGQAGRGVVSLTAGSLGPLHTHLSFDEAGPVSGNITLTRKWESSSGSVLTNCCLHLSR